MKSFLIFSYVISSRFLSITSLNLSGLINHTYKEKTGGYYKKTYAADNAIFAEIGKFFSSNGLQKQEWTKKFVDWCFDNQSKIDLSYRGTPNL